MTQRTAIEDNYYECYEDEDDAFIYLLVCYAKKRDKLLVEMDIFFHFRSLILCNAKQLQFHQNEK